MTRSSSLATRRYLVQPRDRIFVKGYGFLSFAKNVTKNVGKNINRSLSGKYRQKILDHAKQSATDAFKTSSKRLIQKKAEATGYLILIKLLTKLQGFQKIHNKIIQRQLQMKYLKKDIYHQKQDRKLLMH